MAIKKIKFKPKIRRKSVKKTGVPKFYAWCTVGFWVLLAYEAFKLYLKFK